MSPFPAFHSLLRRRVTHLLAGGALATLSVGIPVLRAQGIACDASGIGPAAFRRVLNAQFARAVNAQNAATPGNYGAYDFKDGTVSFNGSIVSESGSVLTMAFHGSGQSGLLPVISERVVNSTFGGELRWHRMATVNRRLRYDAVSCGKYNAAVRAAAAHAAQALAAVSYPARQTRAILASAVQERERAERVRLADNLRAEADSIARAAAALTRASDVGWSRARVAELRARADSVQVEIKADETRTAPGAPSVAVPPVATMAELEINNERIAATEAAERELKVTGFDVRWWTYSVGVRNNSFRLFSPDHPYAAQIEKQQFLTEEASVQLSFLKAGDGGARALRLLTFGVAGLRTDNFDALSPITITEVTQYGATAGQRSSTATIKAMTGAYQTGIWSARLFSDYYRFFRRNNTLGVHVFPEWVLPESDRGHVNFGVGVIALARKSRDDATLINVEPYWLLNDVANRRNSFRAVVGASQVGFRFTLPLNFQTPE